MSESINHPVVMRAVWKDVKHEGAGEQVFFLVRYGKGDYRWVKAADQQEWNGVAYLDTGSAIRAMRVFVESTADMTGIDLTIEDVAESPEMRAAKRIDAIFNAGLTGDEFRLRVAEIIQQESNIGPMTAAFSELLAYIFKFRVAFAMAVCPPMPGKVPRDLTLDGLLLNALEAMSKSTGQDFGNLIKILKEPVGQIIAAKGVPKGGPVQ